MSVTVFFCYAHEDEALLNKLKAHLRPLQRQGLIDVWHDRDISAGTEWESEIKKHLNEAKIILLLVSPDFIDSDYCYGVEMKRAMERHDAGEADVIPIILRPTMWQGTPFGKLQALPIDAIPVVDRCWHSQDEAFYNIATRVGSVIEDFIGRLEMIRQQEKLFASRHEEQIVDTSVQTSQNVVAFPGLDKEKKPHQENTSTTSSLSSSSSNQISFPLPEEKYSPKMVKEDSIVLPSTPKYFLPLNNSDGLLTQRQFEEWCQQNLQNLPGYPSAGNTLQFDGLYRTIGEDSNGYLRFYPDGTVLSVSIGVPSTAEQIAQWFGKGQRAEQGRYKQLGTQIGFTTRGSALVDYVGMIINDHMIFLESYSQTNKYRQFRQYNYHQVAILSR